MATYQPKKGSFLSNADAQLLGEELSLMAANGPLQPETVVEAARPLNAPLHDYFEWDDSVAAEQHRVTQARYYLRKIELVRDNDPPIRAFHAVIMPGTPTQAPQRGYVTVNLVMANTVLLSHVIEQEQRRLEQCAYNLAQYEALAPVAAGPVQAAIAALRELQLAPV